MTGRTPLLRALVGFTLLGAGVVNLGLVRGTFPAPSGFLALGLGVTEVVTALLALADARPRGLGPTTLGRVGIGALVAGSVAQAALAVSSGGTLGPTVTAASVLQLAGAGMLGVLTRAAPDATGRDGTSVPDGPSGSQHPGGPGADTTARSGSAGGLRTAGALAALFAGAILVSTVATFGLGATEAGEHAVPHGDHRPPRPPGLHGHHP